MSGGGPSSIKRTVLCAAASLHIYVPEFFDNGGIAVKKLKKFTNDFFDAVIIGTFIAVIIFYAILLLAVLDSPDKLILALTGILLFINVVCILVCAVAKTFQKPHKYDSELIGYNFVGISKKSRIFRQSVENLFSQSLNQALGGFKEIEEKYADKLAESEKAVLYFYIARCYDIMQYYPNANSYYIMSGKNRADSVALKNILSLLHARCLGAMGDAEDAAEKCAAVLADENNLYRCYVRTDMGRMYLMLDNAEEALKWYGEAIENKENTADAYGGMAVAYAMLSNAEKSENFYKLALINNIDDKEGFKELYNEIRNMPKSKSDHESQEKE